MTFRLLNLKTSGIQRTYTLRTTMPEYKAPQQPVFYRHSTNDGHKVKARQCAHSVVLEKLPEE